MLVGNLGCYNYGQDSEVANCYGFRDHDYNYIPSYQCFPQSGHVAGVKCIGTYTLAYVCNSKNVVHHFNIGSLRTAE